MHLPEREDNHETAEYRTTGQDALQGQCPFAEHLVDSLPAKCKKKIRDI
jgi:hypothetical protein